MIRVSPGSVSPTAASTSATPRKSWNHRGSDAFICAAISGGGERKSQPWARNATASSTCKTQSTMFMTSPSVLYQHVERETLRSTSNHTKDGAVKSGAYWTSSAGMRLGYCSFVWAGNGTHAHSEPIVHPRNEHYLDRRSGLGRFNGGVCLATARHDTESRAGSRGDTHTRCATRARLVLWQGVPGQSHGQRRTLRHERHGCGAPQLPIGDPRPSDESRERPVAGAADPRFEGPRPGRVRTA